jgi:hypothetical protein
MSRYIAGDVEVQYVKNWVLTVYTRGDSFDLQELYTLSDCYDLDMYKAVHDLIIANEIAGMSPLIFDFDSHLDYKYIRL